MVTSAKLDFDRHSRVHARPRELDDLKHIASTRNRAVTIHDEVVQLLLGGGGVEEVTRALANSVGNPILVQDALFRVVAHSFRQGRVDEHRKEIILRRETPRVIFDDESISASFQSLRKDRRAVRLCPYPKYGMEESTLVVPIAFEGGIHGYVSVIESNRQLDDKDISSLEHAVAILALELRRQKTASDVEIRLRGHFLDELVSGSYPSEASLLRRAKALGYDLTRPHQVMVVAIGRDVPSSGVQVAGPSQNKATVEQCYHLVCELLAAEAPEGVAAMKEDAVIVVAPVRKKSGVRSRVDELAKAIKQELNHYLPELAVSIGIGHECHRVSDYCHAHEQARQALGTLACCGRKNEIVSFDSLGIYGLLIGYEDRAKLNRFAEYQLGALVEYDRQHGAELLHTLEVFLREGCNFQRAADTLFVHVNTARYRVQRIEEIVAVDTRDFETCFNLQMALKILRVTRKYLGRSNEGAANAESSNT